jgi:hypothetical protein
MALKEAFASEAVAPDFPFRVGGFLGLRSKAFDAASSDLVAINHVPRSRTKWSLPRIPQEQRKQLHHHRLPPACVASMASTCFSLERCRASVHTSLADSADRLALVVDHRF